MRLQPVSFGQPFSTYRQSNSVRLAACQGDQVCFEIAVDGPTFPDRAVLALSDLRGSGTIPSSAISSYVMSYVASSREGYPLVADRAVRTSNMTATASRLLPMVALLVVDVPKDLPGGSYSGVLAATVQGETSLSTKVELRVFDFPAPSATLELMAGLDLAGLAYLGEPLERAWGRAAELLAGQGFGISTVPPFQPMDIQGGEVSLPPPPAVVKEILSAVPRFVVPLAQAGVGADPNTFLGPPDPAEPIYWMLYAKYVGAAATRLAEIGVLGRAWWQVWDEPTPQSRPWVEKAIETLRAKLPDAPVIVSSHRVWLDLNPGADRWVLPLELDLLSRLPAADDQRAMIWVEADDWCRPQDGFMPLRCGVWWVSAAGLAGIWVRTANAWPAGTEPGAFYDPLAGCLMYRDRTGRFQWSGRALALRQWLIEGAAIRRAAALAEALQPVDEYLAYDLTRLVREGQSFVGPQLFPAADVALAEDYRKRLFEAIEKAEHHLNAMGEGPRP